MTCSIRVYIFLATEKVTLSPSTFTASRLLSALRTNFAPTTGSVLSMASRICATHPIEPALVKQLKKLEDTLTRKPDVFAFPFERWAWVGAVNGTSPSRFYRTATWRPGNSYSLSATVLFSCRWRLGLGTTNVSDAEGNGGL